MLKATPERIFLLISEMPRAVDWSNLPAEQVVGMAEALHLSGPEDRLALGVLCHHSLLASLALKYLTSLDGTPLEAEAKRVLETSA